MTSVSGVSRPRLETACAWNGFEPFEPIAAARFTTRIGAISYHRLTTSCQARASSLRALLRLGLPIGLATLVEVTGFTFMAFFVSRIGATAVAGHQIAANMVSMMFMLPLAIANAASTLVAQQLGAGDGADVAVAGFSDVRGAEFAHEVGDAQEEEFRVARPEREGAPVEAPGELAGVGPHAPDGRARSVQQVRLLAREYRPHDRRGDRGRRGVNEDHGCSTRNVAARVPR